MGFSIGGIATPLPVKVYGRVGTPATSATITKGGFSATDKLQISMAGLIPTTTDASFRIIINDGSAHTFSGHLGAVAYPYAFNATLYASSTNQALVNTGPGAGTSVTAFTTALTMENIVSITAEVYDGGTSVNCLSVIALAEP